LAESEATKKSERENHDVDLFAKLIGEIEILNLLTTNAKIMFQIEDTKRLNPKKETLDPAPLWIRLGGEKSQLIRNQILKAAKKLKNSIEFKNVSISPDISVCQRKKLNNLKASRKELNDELNHLPYEVNYYYGIRNNKITKLKKEIDNGFEHVQLEKKIKDLSDEFKQYKICVSDIINKLTTSTINLRSIINDHIVGLINKSSNQSIDLIKKVVSNAETTTNKINYDIERIAKNNVLNSSVIIRLLDNLEMDDPLSSLIKETLNEVIDKYKIT
jgi:hypothetical protein